MSFKVRTWALGKTMSSLVLIVSTWCLAASAALPLTLAHNSGISAGSGNSYSNITILDLYPELKEYLWQKALSQIESSTENYDAGTRQQQVIPNTGSAWDSSASNSNVNPYTNVNGGIGGLGIFPRGDNVDADPMETFNQHSEILKYYHPFGSPEIYSGWKFKTPTPSYAASSSYPVWGTFNCSNV